MKYFFRTQKIAFIIKETQKRVITAIINHGKENIKIVKINDTKFGISIRRPIEYIDFEYTFDV